MLALAVRASFDPAARTHLAQQDDSPAIGALPRLAARHRVEGLVWDGICQSGLPLPLDVQQHLVERARSIATNNLINIEASTKMSAAFDEKGIAVTFLKGVALAHLVYPRPHAKDSCDIDIMVEPHSLEHSAKILQQLGFALVEPKREDLLRRWHVERKESVWVNPERSIQLDLHTRPIDNPCLAPALCAQATMREVELAPNGRLATYDDIPLYAYLCLHGASSAWFRLKWLADLSAFLHGRSPEEVADVHAAALRLGAGRASGQALLLANRLFGTLLPRDLLQQLKSDAVTRWLVAIASDQLLNDREPTDCLGGTIPIHLSQCLLGPGATYGIRELARQVREIISRPRI